MTEREGEREREVEIRRGGLWEKHEKHTNHSFKRNNFINKKNCLVFSYKSPFIEYRDGE